MHSRVSGSEKQKTPLESLYFEFFWNDEILLQIINSLTEGILQGRYRLFNNNILFLILITVIIYGISLYTYKK